MSTLTEPVARTMGLLGEQLLALGRTGTRRQLEQATGLSRPTLIGAERGEDIQVSTLLRILEAHGKLQTFHDFIAELAGSDAKGCLTPSSSN